MEFDQNTLLAFVNLGKFLGQFSNKGIEKNDKIPFNDLFFEQFKTKIKIAEQHNGWFTKENIICAFETWSKTLNSNDINQWISKYNFNNLSSKNVAIIMAGNIPLVGLHDFLCVLISGHNAVVKQSTNDKYLLPLIASYLEYINPNLKGRITFLDVKLKDYDAVIATGSSNTGRYFEYYFKDKPTIIRKNMNSVAVLDGNETREELKALAEDIFRYFGLGCRNVSKLFVPKNYNFDLFFKAIYRWHPIINHNKYANNYDYNKAVYLMSEFKIQDNGFLILKEDASYSSPIATLFYETYTNSKNLKEKIDFNAEKIQCVVGKDLELNEVNFGETQHPKLWDYADGIDTVDFLLKI